MSAAAIQALSFPVILVLIVALAATMTLRVVRHVRAGTRVPILLRRDVALFVTLVVMLGGGAYARSLGIRLADQVWWVALTNVLAILTLVYWLAVEWGLIRAPEDRP